jgi:hypothetical protein
MEVAALDCFASLAMTEFVVIAGLDLTIRKQAQSRARSAL